MDHNLLSRLPPVGAPPNLFERVMRAIKRARTRRLRVRFALASSGLGISLAYAVVSWSAVWIELRESSSFEFFRLVVSDPDVVLSHMKDLALGVAETLPFAMIILTLVIVFCLIGSVAIADALRHVRRSRPIHHLTP